MIFSVDRVRLFLRGRPGKRRLLSAGRFAHDGRDEREPARSQAQNSALEPEFREAFLRVLRSGHFILGPEVEKFEKSLAEFTGAKHALGVSSGTDAILVALMALGIGPGDEVLCPSFTFFATAGLCVAGGGETGVRRFMPGLFQSRPARRGATDHGADRGRSCRCIFSGRRRRWTAFWRWRGSTSCG